MDIENEGSENKDTENKSPLEYLTPDQGAKYLNVPKSLVYAHRRLFGGVKIGKHIRIPRQAIDKYFSDAAKVAQEEAQEAEKIYQERKSMVREDLFREKYNEPIPIYPRTYRRRKKVTLVEEGLG